MNDTIISFIRTYVPLLVATVVTWIAKRTGFVVPEDVSAQAVTLIIPLVAALWYALVRALESRWPSIGVLLGVPKAPVYES